MTTQSASQDQVMMLLDFLQGHPDLAKGHIRSSEARLRSRRLWDEVTENLNSLGGAVKTASQWQKVWADKKYATKKTAAQRRREATGTGGGPARSNQPTELELRVLGIMGEDFGDRQTSAMVNPFVDLENRPSSSSNTQHHTQEIQLVEEECIIVPEPLDHAYCRSGPLTGQTAAAGPDPADYTNDQASVQRPPSSLARIVRRRGLRAQNNYGERLLEAEAQKRTEIVDLRKALEAINKSLIELVEVLKNK